MLGQDNYPIRLIPFTYEPLLDAERSPFTRSRNGGNELLQQLEIRHAITTVHDSQPKGEIPWQYTNQNGDSADIPEGVAVPKVMETRIGLLEFNDGAPSDETVKKVYDNLDFVRALDAYMNGYQLASLKAMHNGLLAAGVEDNGGC